MDGMGLDGHIFWVYRIDDSFVGRFFVVFEGRQGDFGENMGESFPVFFDFPVFFIFTPTWEDSHFD